jgi:hypothetical protein
MRVTYELWSMTSRSLLGCFDSETEALAAVREAVERNGTDYAAGLALGREDRRGRPRLTAEGDVLVQRALGAVRRDGAR